MKGQQLAARRKELGWSQAYLAELYGTTREAIAYMEKNGLLKDPQRRAVLATLLDIPLVAVGVESQSRERLEALANPEVKTKPIDLIEYQKTLGQYYNLNVTNGYDWEKVATDSLNRIQKLHNKVLYSGAEKLKMVKLLCGFHIVAADIAVGQRMPGAVASFNKAIILAKEYKLPHEYALALFRRGSFLFDRGNSSEAAYKDYCLALKVKNLLPQLKGKLLSGAGRSTAKTADNEMIVKDALNLLDTSAEFISQQIEEESFGIKFDKDRWLLDRATILVGSPLKNYRYPNQALNQLEQVTFPDDSRRSAFRETLSNILQAQAYIDKQDYPFAAHLTSDATKIMGEMHSYVHVPDIESLYNALKASKYGQSKDVLKLNVDLLKVKYPVFKNID